MNLKEIKVVDLSSVLAGPLVAMFFAELSAEVIKFENRKNNGDVTSSWKLNSEKDDSLSAYYLSANWGKKIYWIDFTNAHDMAFVTNEIKTADIVISSFKKGDAEKYCLDYTTIKSIKKDIIYAAISGYGTHDDRLGYDAIIQAESGMMYMNGNPDSNPVKMPLALIDILTAHQCKEAILLALFNRYKTGLGDFIEVNLFQTAVSSLANQALNYLYAGHIPQRIGSDHPNIVPYGTVFYCLDQKAIVPAIGNDRQFHDFLVIIKASELIDDLRFTTNQNRVKHREELKRLIQEKIQYRDRDELIRMAREYKIPLAAVNSLKEVFENELSQDLILKQKELIGLRTIAFQSHFWRSDVEISAPEFRSISPDKINQE